MDDNWLRESPLKRRLREETAELPQAMQISADQGQQLTLLARAVGARRAVEVGSFTGDAARCIATSATRGPGSVGATERSPASTARSRSLSGRH